MFIQKAHVWEPFKDSAPPRSAVGNSETNSQHGNEIHSAVGIGGTCVGFFKGWTVFPHFLWRASRVFALVLTSLQASSRSCQHRRAFIAPLPISRSVHSTVAYREKQHSNCKNFSEPLSTLYRFQFVHSTIVNSCLYVVDKRPVCAIVNSFPNCQQQYEMGLDFKGTVAWDGFFA